MLIKYRECIYSVLTLLVVASLLHPPVVFASTDSQASTQLGIEAFEAGEYQKALDYFAEAIRLGSTKTSLYYNIGVAHYKLAQYKEADEAFAKVEDSPEWGSLALYNRALIAYRQNLPGIAKIFATKSISLSKSPGLTALNYRLIAKVDGTGQKKSAWSQLVRFSVGYDDNVVLSESDAASISGKSDIYFDVVGRASRSTTLKSSRKLKFLVQANMLNYARLNEYDQTGLRTGVEKELGRPNSSLGAYLDYITLGGNSYELATTLEYRRTFTSNKSNPPVFTYSFKHYSMLNSTYDYLGGVRHRVRLSRKRKLDNGSLTGYLQGEYNDRQDQTTMTNFYSFSPARIGVGTIYVKNLSSRDFFSGSLFLQQSRFLDPDKRSGVSRTREDGMLEFRLGLAHVSATSWIYRANFIRTTNDSNYPEYSYERNILSFEMFKSF